MITVPEATQKIIMRSRYLSEAMSKGLINNSSLARYIKPEIEEMLIKQVSLSAIIMALNRISAEIKPKYFAGNIFKTPPQIIVRSKIDNNEFKDIFSNLSSITITMPKEAIKTPGILYFFLKSLAWEGINVVDIKASLSEITIILEEKDTDRVFGIIKSLFSKTV